MAEVCKQMQIQGGLSDHLLLPFWWLLCCHYLFMPKTFHFHFHLALAKGSHRSWRCGCMYFFCFCCSSETWKLGYWRLFRATRSCHAISIFVWLRKRQPQRCRTLKKKNPSNGNRKQPNPIDDEEWELCACIVHLGSSFWDCNLQVNWVLQLQLRPFRKQK